MLWELSGETKPLAHGVDEDNGPVVFPGIQGTVRRRHLFCTEGGPEEIAQGLTAFELVAHSEDSGSIPSPHRVANKRTLSFVPPTELSP